MNSRERKIRVAFNQTWIDQGAGGRFEFMLSKEALSADSWLVIDVYDSVNSLHPEGHIGWWKFPISGLKVVNLGVLDLEGSLDCRVNGQTAVQEWINEVPIPKGPRVVNAVLRSRVTNAIQYLERIPAFLGIQEYEASKKNVNRAWEMPRYAPANYIFPSGVTVRLVAPDIMTRDVVGNFCLEFYRILKQNHIPVLMYAERLEMSLNDIVKRVDVLYEEASPQDVLVYFSSTYGGDLEALLNLSFSRRIAYFHGITPPELIQVFDPELSMVCKKAYEQLRLLETFDLIAANSNDSAKVLLHHFRGDTRWKLEDIQIIPSKFFPLNFQADMRLSLEKKGMHFLYVGSVQSHKKVEDLLTFFASYLRLDPNAELWIVGSGGKRPYLDYLHFLEKSHLNLSTDQVRWLGDVTDAKLQEIYHSATAYLSMSEHEGFCVHAFEAMLAGLPVFSYGLPAVREVLGDTGVYFIEKSFDSLVPAIQLILNCPEQVSEISKRQHRRALQMAEKMDGSQMLALLAPVEVTA